jgi:hypothetical protein
MIRLSKTSKLGCLSWSLEARATCPGSINPKTKQLVDACAGCYAASGNYRFANVKKPRAENREDWRRAGWVADMVNALQSERKFRWFDSGDCYALPLARKMLEVMRALPHVRFWLPTRMHKFAKFRAVFEEMRALPNVAVRYSSDSVTGQFERGLHGSTIAPQGVTPMGTTLCTAYTRGGECGPCEACFDPSVEVITYPAHGVSMARVIRLKLAA